VTYISRYISGRNGKVRVLRGNAEADGRGLDVETMKAREPVQDITCGGGEITTIVPGKKGIDSGRGNPKD
jgi:hypothetical protein